MPLGGGGGGTKDRQQKDDFNKCNKAFVLFFKLQCHSHNQNNQMDNTIYVVRSSHVPFSIFFIFIFNCIIWRFNAFDYNLSTQVCFTFLGQH